MKIYESTEYIEPRDVKVGNLRLSVNSMWDFKARAVCFDKNKHSMDYDLEECVEVISPTYTKWARAEITEEIKEELIANGYTLAREFKETLIESK